MFVKVFYIRTQKSRCSFRVAALFLWLQKGLGLFLIFLTCFFHCCMLGWFTQFWSKSTLFRMWAIQHPASFHTIEFPLSWIDHAVSVEQSLHIPVIERLLTSLTICAEKKERIQLIAVLATEIFHRFPEQWAESLEILSGHYNVVFYKP